MKTFPIDSKVAMILACLVSLDAAGVCEAQWSAGDGAFPDAVASAVCPAGAFAIANSPNAEGSASAAFDGTNYLMVWSNEETNLIDPIYGEFVSPSGALVGGPFLISQGAENEEAAGIVFDGTDYLAGC
jgi:hypothetical protein